MGIAARWQGRGLAKKMVAHAIDDGRKKGLKAIRLDALPTNIPAHRLYLSMGFTYVGTIQIYYEDTGLTDFYLFELCI